MTRIELCGLPASGKSTLYRSALRLLKGRGIPVLGRDDAVGVGLRTRDFGLIANFIGAMAPVWRRRFLGLPHGLDDWHRFAVKYPAFVALLHKWLAEGAEDTQWYSTVFYSFLVSAFEYELSEGASATVLFDEGFVHRFFSIRGYRGIGVPGDAAIYAASMPMPSAVILVTAPAETCMERIKTRDHVPILLALEPDNQRSIRLAEGGVLLIDLAKELERRGVSVLTVDGTGDVQSESLKTADFIAQACKKRGSGE